MVMSQDVEKMEEHHYHLLTENKFSLNEITEEDDENEKM
jgi:hypothetical protein